MKDVMEKTSLLSRSESGRLQAWIANEKSFFV